VTGLSLSETQKRLTDSGESADNRFNERSLPIDLVRDCRALASSIASRNTGPSTSAQWRKSPKRVIFGNIDRLLFVGLYRFSPKVLEALKILKPETVLRWHRSGFRAYWRWKSRSCGGRPKTPVDIRQLIREMSDANPLWGAPRIHGELLKLGTPLIPACCLIQLCKRQRRVTRKCASAGRERPECFSRRSAVSGLSAEPTDIPVGKLSA
jgi:hypothetical protein